MFKIIVFFLILSFTHSNCYSYDLVVSSPLTLKEIALKEHQLVNHLSLAEYENLLLKWNPHISTIDQLLPASTKIYTRLPFDPHIAGSTYSPELNLGRHLAKRLVFDLGLLSTVRNFQQQYQEVSTDNTQISALGLQAHVSREWGSRHFLSLHFKYQTYSEQESIPGLNSVKFSNEFAAGINFATGFGKLDNYSHPLVSVSYEKINRFNLESLAQTLSLETENLGIGFYFLGWHYQTLLIEKMPARFILKGGRSFTEDEPAYKGEFVTTIDLAKSIRLRTTLEYFTLTGDSKLDYKLLGLGLSFLF